MTRVPATPPASRGTPAASPPTASPADGRPHLLRAAPNSASVDNGVVVEVELRGSGFTPTGNAVQFGPLSAGTVPSADGKTIRFTVPQQYPPRGEVPPMSVPAGAYPVTVRNANGSSDTLVFTLRSGPR